MGTSAAVVETVSRSVVSEATEVNRTDWLNSVTVTVTVTGTSTAVLIVTVRGGPWVVPEWPDWWTREREVVRVENVVGPVIGTGEGTG